MVINDSKTIVYVVFNPINNTYRELVGPEYPFKVKWFEVLYKTYYRD